MFVPTLRPATLMQIGSAHESGQKEQNKIQQKRVNTENNVRARQKALGTRQARAEMYSLWPHNHNPKINMSDEFSHQTYSGSLLHKITS